MPSKSRTCVLDPRYPDIVFAGREPDVVPPKLPRGVADYPSILVLHGLPDEFGPEDLARINALGYEITADWDALERAARAQANMLEIREQDGLWLARKMSWTTDSYAFVGFEEAITAGANAFHVDPAVILGPSRGPTAP